MAETALTVGEHTFELRRPHTSTASPFRAWSAADLLTINELAPLAVPSKVLVINDSWGAVSVAAAAAGHEVVTWNDSLLNRTAIEANFAANGINLDDSQLLGGDDIAAAGWADAAVLLPTKHGDLTAWQSGMAASALAPDGVAFAASMSKHLSKATMTALATGFGVVESRRAVGKARIVDLSEPKGERVSAVRPRAAFTTPEGVSVHSLAGVFGNDRLDPATSLLLETLEDPVARSMVAEASHVVDLGCGNGVLATTLAQRHRDPHFYLLDASDRALLAAAATWTAAGLDDERATIALSDGCAAVGDASVDLVVSNPPFHQGYAVDTALAHRLVGGAARVLRSGGALVAVAHRSVDLHHGLSRAFGEVKAVSRHPNFVVLVAREPQRSA